MRLYIDSEEVSGDKFNQWVYDLEKENVVLKSRIDNVLKLFDCDSMYCMVSPVMFIEKQVKDILKGNK